MRISLRSLNSRGSVMRVQRRKFILYRHTTITAATPTTIKHADSTPHMHVSNICRKIYYTRYIHNIQQCKQSNGICDRLCASQTHIPFHIRVASVYALCAYVFCGWCILELTPCPTQSLLRSYLYNVIERVFLRRSRFHWFRRWLELFLFFFFSWVCVRLVIRCTIPFYLPLNSFSLVPSLFLSFSFNNRKNYKRTCSQTYPASNTHLKDEWMWNERRARGREGERAEVVYGGG